MFKTIKEMFREAWEKVKGIKKNDNGIIYEIVPPCSGNNDSEHEKAEEKEERYCPYCCLIVNAEGKYCPNCGLELPEKNYKQELKSSGMSFEIDVGNIIANIANDVEPPAPVEIKTHEGNSLIIKPIMTDQKFVRYYPTYENRINLYCNLRRFTVIDFETANMYPDSVCQMGIVVVEDKKIVSEKVYLIRPPYNDFRNATIHGIKLSDVREEKSFFELWGEIKPFIERRLVGAYNANFDIGCLLALLENFKIEMPDFAYFDILQNVREKFKGEFSNYKLKTVAKSLKIKHEAHNAISDAQAAADIQIKCDMSSTFSMMYSSENKHFEVMTELFTSREIMSYVRKGLKEITSTNFEEYGKIIRMLTVAERNGEEKAKVLKVRGEIFERCGKNQDALSSYEQAYKLNDKIGVKGRIQKLKKKCQE